MQFGMSTTINNPETFPDIYIVLACGYLIERGLIALILFLVTGEGRYIYSFEMLLHNKTQMNGYIVRRLLE